MKKVLIATTNKDKYKIVAELFRKTIFSSVEYEISPITNDMNIPDEKETDEYYLKYTKDDLMKLKKLILSN